MKFSNSGLIILSCILLFCVKFGTADQHTHDAIDEVWIKMKNIKKDDCSNMDDLSLLEDSLTHQPDSYETAVNPVLQRTNMFQLRNTALNRAFFWSFILQSRFLRPVIEETHDPGMMYYFLSSVADVASNSLINASSLYFSPQMSYTSSYRGYFNKTLPRFAPRAYRHDYLKNNAHLQNMSSLNALVVEDLGAFDREESLSKDYASSELYNNEWYKLWLPDGVENNTMKTAYRVEITYANNTSVTFDFFGPPGMDEEPVKWTRPYYDCERLNKWLVGAVSPVADLYPRHTNFKHIENPTYTAATVMEMDFEQIDINQCPLKTENKHPNLFASTAHCQETTECEPIPGWGFRRGGYQCRCAPGYRPPPHVNRTFLGGDLEQHHLEQLHNTSSIVNKFRCEKTERPQPRPYYQGKVSTSLRSKYMKKYPAYDSPTKGPRSLYAFPWSIYEVLNYVHGVTPETCTKYERTDLILHKAYLYGAKKQFQNQAKLAVRLANFISAYLQINNPDEGNDHDDLLADKPLTEDQMFGESLSIILADPSIVSAGTFWDEDKFSNRTFFAPFAYFTKNSNRKIKLEDLAREGYMHKYYNEFWFYYPKIQWSKNTDNLEKFYVKIKTRNDPLGNKLKRYKRFPVSYRAASINGGHWDQPTYDCHGLLKQWVITYTVPFYGWDSTKSKLEFKGAVAITMSLDSLDINQCDDIIENAFTWTNKCDAESSYCVPVPGHGFNVGGYKCECRPGYEYPFDDSTTYFSGELVEAELKNLVDGKPSLIEMLKCRPVNNYSNTSSTLAKDTLKSTDDTYTDYEDTTTEETLTSSTLTKDTLKSTDDTSTNYEDTTEETLTSTTSTTFTKATLSSTISNATREHSSALYSNTNVTINLYTNPNTNINLLVNIFSNSTSTL